MSWLRTLLIFFTAVTAVSLVLNLGTGLYQILFGSYEVGINGRNPFLPFLELLSDSMYHLISVLLAGFAISVLAKEERERKAVIMTRTKLSIALFVCGALLIVLATLNFMSLFAILGSAERVVRLSLNTELLINLSASVSSTALFGLILIFAGRFLSRNSTVSAYASVVGCSLKNR